MEAMFRTMIAGNSKPTGNGACGSMGQRSCL